ncbi:MAG: hypothetical protein MUO24_01930 [Desulfobacterales bacterium]|nr:hypothetical protein [Desulfobacterales bacterium]
MKKRYIIAWLLPFLLWVQASRAEIVCPEIEYDESYKSNLPTVDEEEIIQSDRALFPNGILKCQVSFSYKTLKNNKRMRIEEGTYDGVRYRIFFSDGSGSIQGLPTNTLYYVKDKYGTNWSTQCKLDEMDDTHWCSLNKGDLRVGIWKDGTLFVSVGSSHYPNSKIAVRVDKNKPISASEKSGFTKAQSEAIIEELMKGNSVLTRYQEWPYQSNKDKSVDLFGFPQAWEILQKIYKSVGSQQ